jgi:hypothetical protein
MSHPFRKQRRAKRQERTEPRDERRLSDGDKDWETPCVNCGQVPTVHPTGLCGPCCFGSADTVGGNW